MCKVQLTSEAGWFRICFTLVSKTHTPFAILIRFYLRGIPPAHGKVVTAYEELNWPYKIVKSGMGGPPREGLGTTANFLMLYEFWKNSTNAQSCLYVLHWCFTSHSWTLHINIRCWQILWRIETRENLHSGVFQQVSCATVWRPVCLEWKERWQESRHSELLRNCK